MWFLQNCRRNNEISTLFRLRLEILCGKIQTEAHKVTHGLTTRRFLSRTDETTGYAGGMEGSLW